MIAKGEFLKIKQNKQENLVERLNDRFSLVFPPPSFDR